MLGSIGERVRMGKSQRTPHSSSWFHRNLEQAELLGQQVRRRVLRTFPFSHFRGRDYRSRLAALMTASKGVYGESAGEWTATDALGFSKIVSLSGMFYSRAGAQNA